MTDDDLETSRAVMLAAAVGFAAWYLFLWMLAIALEAIK